MLLGIIEVGSVRSRIIQEVNQSHNQSTLLGFTKEKPSY